MHDAKKTCSWAGSNFNLSLLLLQGVASAAEAHGLWPLLDRFKAAKYVDLTHVWAEDTPHWKGFDPAIIKTIYSYEKDGFWAQLYAHVGQWGTHVDPPPHFHKGKRTLEDIP